MKRSVIRRDEMIGATLNLGGAPISLDDYATRGLLAAAIAPRGMGKTSAGLLMAEQLSAQGIGFTEQEAARRAKITVPQFQDALRGADWRGTGAIPLATVQAVIKRLHASPGYSIAEAARAIGKDAAWVEDRIRDGTVRPLRTRHTPGRLYLSEPMIRRLRAAVVAPRAQTVPQEGWLRLGEAALDAGVTAATIIKWAAAGELERTRGPNSWRYAQDAVRARAQAYWRTSRFHRATPPVWLRSATVT